MNWDEEQSKFLAVMGDYLNECLAFQKQIAEVCIRREQMDKKLTALQDRFYTLFAIHGRDAKKE